MIPSLSNHIILIFITIVIKYIILYIKVRQVMVFLRWVSISFVNTCKTRWRILKLVPWLSCLKILIKTNIVYYVISSKHNSYVIRYSKNNMNNKTNKNLVCKKGKTIISICLLHKLTLWYIFYYNYTCFFMTRKFCKIYL